MLARLLTVMAMSTGDVAMPFEDQVPHLFGQLSGDDDAAVVCVDHQRFIPCRQCMHVAPAATPYSDDPTDVDRVRAFQAYGDKRSGA